MEMTIEDFKKLFKFQEQYMIYMDNEEVLLSYDKEEDEDGDKFETEWDRWTFTFRNDRLYSVYHCNEFLKADWTVCSLIEVDWRCEEP